MRNRQVLFVHTNYPAQFRFVIKEFDRLGWDIYFACHTFKNKPLPSIRIIQLNANSSVSAESKSKQLENRGIETFFTLLNAKRQGLDPELIYVHSGWGLGYFIRDIFPKSKIIAYSEWWFDINSEDFHFDPTNKEVCHTDRSKLQMILRNQGFALELSRADCIIAPTNWQKRQLPSRFRENCKVVFDGIDVEMFSPGLADASSSFNLVNSIKDDDMVITYATRGLEPYRGFPEFCSAIIKVLKNAPNLKLLIAGKDKPSYFAQHKVKYGEQAMNAFKNADVAHQVFMLGSLSLNNYRDLLRRSDLHCYFTRPYVLSWSCLEAAMIGCEMLVSSVSPVKEFLKEDQSTRLIDHTSSELAEDIQTAVQTVEAKLKHQTRHEIKQETRERRDPLRQIIERKNCVKKHNELAMTLLGRDLSILS